MLDTIFKFLKFLWDLWNSLPDDVKNAAKQTVGDSFEGQFRDFYRANEAG
jgi:hypothetical protein